MKKLEEIKDILSKYNQEHLLNYYNDLTDVEKEKLLIQISNIDFEMLNNLYMNANNNITGSDTITPIEYIDKDKLSIEDKNRYIEIGEKIYSNGEFAFVTMAGGQGTRLGHNGPKGTFNIGIEPDKSLFEITCDRLKMAAEKYNIYIPWYIMTSRENNQDSIDFFEKNNYFNYPKEYVKFFMQGELPMILANTGKVILENKGQVKEAADGHGGIFEALAKNNIVNDMKAKNIKWVIIGGIDNAILNMIDPLYVGITKEHNAKLASKSVVKVRPEEKVGVFCKRNGKPSVVEYIEITEEMSNMRDEQGELMYGESNIICHLLSIEALERIENEKLPYHTALKKSDYLDENGNLIIAESPNAYKFESFIFDAFNKFDDMLVLRTCREKEFAPIKNKEGVDSPETARKLYMDYWNL